MILEDCVYFSPKLFTFGVNNRFLRLIFLHIWFTIRISISMPISILNMGTKMNTGVKHERDKRQMGRN